MPVRGEQRRLQAELVDGLPCLLRVVYERCRFDVPPALLRPVPCECTL